MEASGWMDEPPIWSAYDFQWNWNSTQETGYWSTTIEDDAGTPTPPA
jgi:hypothetical protein